MSSNEIATSHINSSYTKANMDINKIITPLDIKKRDFYIDRTYLNGISNNQIDGIETFKWWLGYNYVTKLLKEQEVKFAKEMFIKVFKNEDDIMDVLCSDRRYVNINEHYTSFVRQLSDRHEHYGLFYIGDSIAIVKRMIENNLNKALLKADDMDSQQRVFFILNSVYPRFCIGEDEESILVDINTILKDSLNKENIQRALKLSKKLNNRVIYYTLKSILPTRFFDFKKDYYSKAKECAIKERNNHFFRAMAKKLNEIKGME